jgi:hypothetical protein
MDIMSHRVLRLIGIGAFAIAVPQLASATDSGSSAEFKLAMGPTSAAQKNQGPSTTSDTPVTTPTPHHRTKHKHKHKASAY